MKKSQQERIYCDNRNVLFGRESAEARIRIATTGPVGRLGIEIGTANTQSESSSSASVQDERGTEENHKIGADNASSSVSDTSADNIEKSSVKSAKNKIYIGEYKLFTMYFDPILSSLLSDPNRNVLLRWLNLTSDECGSLCPDATISKINQRDFGASLGFEEVKVAYTVTANYVLCHYLLRLRMFSKGKIDSNKLQSALTFQIHRSQITFFLTRWNVSYTGDWSAHVSPFFGRVILT